jgi:hypothetical protein
MTAPGQVRDQASNRWPLTYRAVPVPYVVAWSTEDATDVASGQLALRSEAFTGLWQVRYRDEQPTDRDRHGILWHRVAWAPGQGEPLYAEIHTLRQRRALSRALCQICAGTAQIWMTPALLWDEHLAEHGPAAPYPTNDPPVCRPCAAMAARYCPELIRGRIYLSPRAWAITGVRGQLADPTGGGFTHPRILALPTATSTPDRAALGLMLAKGLVATLYNPVPHTDPSAATGLGTRIDLPVSMLRPGGEGR